MPVGTPTSCAWSLGAQQRCQESPSGWEQPSPDLMSLRQDFILQIAVAKNFSHMLSSPLKMILGSTVSYDLPTTVLKIKLMGL